MVRRTKLTVWVLAAEVNCLFVRRSNALFQKSFESS